MCDIWPRAEWKEKVVGAICVNFMGTFIDLMEQVSSNKK